MPQTAMGGLSESWLLKELGDMHWGRIGRDTIINTLSSVDHDCVLGALSQVTAGVTFGGGVRTGVNCFFGIKSAVVPNTTIGDKVQLMAGSLIVSDVESNVVMGGNPARLVKRL
jgi:UDP-3-O-[3-hydroxymyristoyl] glucosamine N-acyltransferase